MAMFLKNKINFFGDVLKENLKIAKILQEKKNTKKNAALHLQEKEEI